MFITDYAVPIGNVGMKLIAENQDGAGYALPLGFTLRYNNADIVNAYSGGDSYVDFGLGMCIFYINKRDESFNKLYTQQGEDFNGKHLRIRFEGNSPWSPWNKNNLVWELTIFSSGVFMLVMDKLNTTAIGERKFYVPILNTTVNLPLEEGKSFVFIPKDANGMDYEIREGSWIVPNVRYLITNKVGYYTIENNLVKSINITPPLTKQHFLDYGCPEIPDDNNIYTLKNPSVLVWNETYEDISIKATVTGIVKPQLIITDIADMSDETIVGIKSIECDIIGDCLISISWNDGTFWEYYDGNIWSEANTDAGMTSTEISAITTQQWKEYLAAKNSKQYKLRVKLFQGSEIKSIKTNYVNKEQ